MRYVSHAAENKRTDANGMHRWRHLPVLSPLDGRVDSTNMSMWQYRLIYTNEKSYYDSS